MQISQFFTCFILLSAGITTAQQYSEREILFARRDALLAKADYLLARANTKPKAKAAPKSPAPAKGKGTKATVQPFCIMGAPHETCMLGNNPLICTPPCTHDGNPCRIKGAVLGEVPFVLVNRRTRAMVFLQIPEQVYLD